jgi:glycosyltransferase involved in cell wall biosynthesis
VREAYGVEADVLPPPFGVDGDGPRTPVAALADWADGYHLVVSRLLPYKNVDRAIEAFRDTSDASDASGRRLVVVGHGPLEAALRETLPDNVRLVSHLTDDELRWTYAHATCLVAPSLEDFGLTPIEAAAFGKPTLALHAGGYLDTIDEQVNGVFFPEATAQSIRDAVDAGQSRRWDPELIRAHALQFSEAAFVERLRAEVEALLHARQRRSGHS